MSMEEQERIMHEIIPFMHDNHVAGPILEIGSSYAVNQKKIAEWNPGIIARTVNLDYLARRK